MLSTVRQPFARLLTVPTSIALLIGFSCVLIVLAERAWFPDLSLAMIGRFEAGSARALLGAIAGGAMSALALSYSLTLVVFTLAAGNIGPRLLRRFSTDPVAQVTAGILGGTFLYALMNLAFIREDSIPVAATAGAAVLAVLSVLQLIFFVRNVSESVSIDDEIASISKGLLKTLESLPDRDSDSGDVKDEPAFDWTITAPESGYIGSVDNDSLVEWARKNDTTVKICKRQGLFVLEGEPLILVGKQSDKDTDRRLLASMVTLTDTRTDDGSVDFPLNLLVEIGLRALSPGINDTFTATATVDSLSNILARLDGKRFGGSRVSDEDGNLRLVRPGLDLSELVGQALHPLRRAAAGNGLMGQSLARALANLHRVGSPELREIAERHARMLIENFEKGDLLEGDLEAIRELLPPLD